MFFSYVCMENLLPHMLDYVDLWLTLIVNWVIKAEYLTIAQVSSFYEPASVNIDVELPKCGITAIPSLEDSSNTVPGWMFGSSCHFWSLIS